MINAVIEPDMNATNDVSEERMIGVKVMVKVVVVIRFRARRTV